jgi:hypothetical protein
MPDAPFGQDILAWSEHQASLLTRLSQGEQVAGVDWGRIIDQIRDVGLSEFNTLRGDLRQIMVHLLKLHGWPDSQACVHWRLDVAGFQAEAAQRCAPSMRVRVDLAGLYRRALRQLTTAKVDGRTAANFPEICPFTLDDLLTGDPLELEARLIAAAEPD